VQLEGERINLLPALVGLLQEFPKVFRRQQLQELDPERHLIVPLDDGRRVPVPLGRIRHILETLFELYQADALNADARLRLSRIQLARLAELDELAGQTPMHWLGSSELRDLAERLRGIDGIPDVAAPAGLKTTLRDYQQHGLAWLQFLREYELAGLLADDMFLREYELAGLLADDMGLGKTVQALAHLLLEKEQGRADRPSLVVAPTSLMGNWRREARQFTPDLRVLTLHGPRRREQFAAIADHDLVLTTYPLLVRDRQALLAHDYHLLILDEAQIIKNPGAQASRMVRELRARQRLCLTGTPMENHLGELWSLFDFLLPGLLGDARQFRRVFRNPVEKAGDTTVAAQLARRVRPFLLRRTKEAVVRELPPKTEIVRSVELEGMQRDLYESIRLAMHQRVRREVAEKGLARSQIVILDALLKLRQVCCDPRLVKLESARKVQHSAKLEMLLELLPGMLEEGRRVLLFSQFTGMLKLIEARVKEAGVDYVKLTGQTRDRTTPVARFQCAEVPLFLISLKAGGLGLNLTAADTVIHYDPWWNPAVERQATDRAHRIGQENPVFVYKLIAEGTVEEKIQSLQARKQALADSLFERKEGGGVQWTAADLEALFEPLE
jgi:SNF2 family DNA or RNA helicase